MPLVVLALLALLQAGCVTTAVWTTYEVATDARPVETQHLDLEIQITLKTQLLESEVAGTGWLEVHCRRGTVVLAGVTEPRSPAAREAVALANRLAGVRRIETYFVPSRPSYLSDLMIKLKVNAQILMDWDLRLSQVSMSVLAGHVVLVGVVDREEKVKKIMEHARTTDGVVAVKSFIHVVPMNGVPKNGVPNGQRPRAT